MLYHLYILDDENYQRMQHGQPLNWFGPGPFRGPYDMGFTLPHPGAWYLVVYNPGPTPITVQYGFRLQRDLPRGWGRGWLYWSGLAVLMRRPRGGDDPRFVRPPSCAPGRRHEGAWRGSLSRTADLDRFDPAFVSRWMTRDPADWRVPSRRAFPAVDVGMGHGGGVGLMMAERAEAGRLLGGVVRWDPVGAPVPSRPRVPVEGSPEVCGRAVGS